MWEKIKEKFSDFPAQQLVALTMIRQGLRVDDKGNIFCGNIEMSPSKFARGIGVDRRAVTAAAGRMAKDEELKAVFSNIKPASELSGIAKQLDFGVIELRADAKRVGLLARITSMISARGISIRQLISDDPELVPEPRAIIITDRPVPGDMLNEFLKIDGVTEVHIK